MVPLNVPLHPTQLYEIVGNLLLFLLLYGLRMKKMADGHIFLLYAIMYSVLRCGIQSFRDDSIYLWNMGLTLTHVVAGATIVFGCVCIHMLRNSGTLNQEAQIGKEKR